MLSRLGPVGLLGLVVMLGGIVLIGLESWQIALGIALVVAGLGLVVQGLIRGMLGAWGMA